MRELIKTLLGDIVRKIVPDFKGGILVEVSGNKEHGDYTTNIVFALTKILPARGEIAEYLINKLKKQKIKDFSKIETKNGFINFFLSPECLHHQIKEILKQKNKYGWIDTKKSPPSLKLRRAMQVEFISANPTGPLTIGNGRGGSYGDTLANVLETQGHKVVREFFINDRGGQILALGRSIKLAQGEKLDLEKTESENLYQGDYINDLARQINNGLSVEEAGQKATELILETYIKPAVKRLGIKFDSWFSEKSLYKGVKYGEIMEDLMRRDFIYEKDGATWMKTSELGDDKDRVLIKSSGDETYFMSDILYHFNKFNVRKFDKVINIWGADHHGDVPRLLGALKIMGIDLERLDIMLYQFVRLIKNGKEFKVSKRAGTFVTLEELINEVGLGATRFFFLMYSPNTHMDFDMKLAKERSQKNPVYYVQYAHARISSILRKAKAAGGKNLELLKEKEELNLIRKLAEFPELLSEISINYEVHRLPRYALELAREFHNFYEKYRVITEDKNLTSARLALVTATKIVLANALNLMGIKAPDKM
ncbi:MAG: arginine--tRNA ligase [Candidatus Azambacteria bacterium]|nr:arginine--tRNA ligase [Candidatus Azambacteria bacterium]